MNWWPCPTCEGSSLVPLPDDEVARRANNKLYYGRGKTHAKCPDCDGDGLSEAAKQITELRDEVKSLTRDVGEIKAILERHFNDGYR